MKTETYYIDKSGDYANLYNVILLARRICEEHGRDPDRTATRSTKPGSKGYPVVKVGQKMFEAYVPQATKMLGCLIHESGPDPGPGCYLGLYVKEMFSAAEERLVLVRQL